MLRCGGLLFAFAVSYYFRRERPLRIPGAEMHLQVMIVALLAGMSPGPDFFLVMKNSLGYGRRIGMASAAGIAAALAVHACYTIVGLALIIQHYRWLFQAIQIFGALYLAYLGVSTIVATFRKKAKEAEADLAGKVGKKSVFQGFMNGFLCNILNPKAFVFFLSVFSQFLTKDSSKLTELVYGIEVVAVIGAWFVFVAAMVSIASFRALYRKIEKWLERFFGVVLLFFAAKIIKSAIAR
jgi:RhtB (resistance to homoserine/threonine) family protein